MAKQSLGEFSINLNTNDAKKELEDLIKVINSNITSIKKSNIEIYNEKDFETSKKILTNVKKDLKDLNTIDFKDLQTKITNVIKHLNSTDFKIKGITLKDTNSLVKQLKDQSNSISNVINTVKNPVIQTEVTKIKKDLTDNKIEDNLKKDLRLHNEYAKELKEIYKGLKDTSISELKTKNVGLSRDKVYSNIEETVAKAKNAFITELQNKNIPINEISANQNRKMSSSIRKNAWNEYFNDYVGNNKTLEKGEEKFNPIYDRLKAIQENYKDNLHDKKQQISYKGQSDVIRSDLIQQLRNEGIKSTTPQFKQIVASYDYHSNSFKDNQVNNKKEQLRLEKEIENAEKSLDKQRSKGVFNQWTKEEKQKQQNYKYTPIAEERSQFFKNLASKNIALKFKENENLRFSSQSEMVKFKNQIKEVIDIYKKNSKETNLYGSLQYNKDIRYLNEFFKIAEQRKSFLKTDIGHFFGIPKPKMYSDERIYNSKQDRSLFEKMQDRGMNSMISGFATRLMGIQAVMSGLSIGKEATDKYANAEKNKMSLNTLSKNMGISKTEVDSSLGKVMSVGMISKEDAISSMKIFLEMAKNNGVKGTEAIKMATDSMMRQQIIGLNGMQHQYKTVGEAMIAYYTGLKDGNSKLSDATGMTKNISVMEKEYKRLNQIKGDLFGADKMKAYTEEEKKVFLQYSGELGNLMKSPFVQLQIEMNRQEEAQIKLGESLIKTRLTWEQLKSSFMENLSGSSGIDNFIASILKIPNNIQNTFNLLFTLVEGSFNKLNNYFDSFMHKFDRLKMNKEEYDKETKKIEEKTKNDDNAFNLKLDQGSRDRYQDTHLLGVNKQNEQSKPSTLNEFNVRYSKIGSDLQSELTQYHEKFKDILQKQKSELTDLENERKTNINAINNNTSLSKTQKKEEIKKQNEFTDLKKKELVEGSYDSALKDVGKKKIDLEKNKDELTLGLQELLKKTSKKNEQEVIKELINNIKKLDFNSKDLNNDLNQLKNLEGSSKVGYKNPSDGSGRGGNSQFSNDNTITNLKNQIEDLKAKLSNTEQEGLNLTNKDEVKDNDKKLTSNLNEIEFRRKMNLINDEQLYNQKVIETNRNLLQQNILFDNNITSGEKKIRTLEDSLKLQNQNYDKEISNLDKSNKNYKDNLEKITLQKEVNRLTEQLKIQQERNKLTEELLKKGDYNQKTSDFLKGLSQDYDVNEKQKKLLKDTRNIDNNTEKEKFDIEKLNTQAGFKEKMGSISIDTLDQVKIDNEEKLKELVMQNYDDKMKLYKDDLDKYNEILQEKERAERDFSLRIMNLQNEQAINQTRNSREYANLIRSEFRNMGTNIMDEYRTISQRNDEESQKDESKKMSRWVKLREAMKKAFENFALKLQGKILDQIFEGFTSGIQGKDGKTGIGFQAGAWFQDLMGFNKDKNENPNAVKSKGTFSKLYGVLSGDQVYDKEGKEKGTDTKSWWDNNNKPDKETVKGLVSKGATSQSTAITSQTATLTSQGVTITSTSSNSQSTSAVINAQAVTVVGGSGGAGGLVGGAAGAAAGAGGTSGGAAATPTLATGGTTVGGSYKSTLNMNAPSFGSGISNNNNSKTSNNNFTNMINIQGNIDTRTASQIASESVRQQTIYGRNL